ncbi:MAG: sulfotransferase domain-containing protein [Flavobacteriaceae bacterium]|nr:sulfotransferase domain-containing protein [Flavobacteriaceae bacterium]
MNKYRLHIVSSGPRTGTTLLHEAMKTCFEFDFASDHEDSICRSNKELGAEYKRILTKNPAEFFYLNLPLFLDKKLFVICLIRDPRDMVCSFHGRFPDTYYASLKYWKYFLRSYKLLKNHNRILFIKYEDFTQNPDETQNLIIEKFPFLEFKFSFSDYHLHAKPSSNSLKALKNFRPIMANGVGSWRNHVERISSQINIHGDIGQSLIEFGYENDLEWKKSLPLNFKTSPTKLNESFSYNDLFKRKRKIILASLKILKEKVF